MSSKEAEIFAKYVPKQSLAYCLDLWRTYKIHFTISRPRNSLYGNYSFRNGVHRISVNGDLNKEAFLVTFLHEVAHLMVQAHCIGRRKPHGEEWQRYFHQVLLPVLHLGVFQPKTLFALRDHIQNPRATTSCDPELHQLLMGEEAPPQEENGEILARDLKPGEYFSLRDRRFQMNEVKRSRVWVKDPKTGVQYSVPFLVKVRRITREEALRDLPPKTVGQVPGGLRFSIGTSVYQVVEHKRTWTICLDVKTNRFYQIRKDFPVNNEPG